MKDCCWVLSAVAGSVHAPDTGVVCYLSYFFFECRSPHFTT